MCCSVLQSVAAHCILPRCLQPLALAPVCVSQREFVCCDVLQCAVVYSSVLQCGAACCSVLQYVAGGCSELLYDAVCCIGMMQCAFQSILPLALSFFPPPLSLRYFPSFHRCLSRMISFFVSLTLNGSCIWICILPWDRHEDPALAQQHTITHCNVKHCNTPRCNTLQHVVTCILPCRSPTRNSAVLPLTSPVAVHACIFVNASVSVCECVCV